MGKDTPETEVIQFAQDRQVSLSSVLRESLRNSDRFCVLKTRRHHAVFDKSDFTPDDAGQWIEQIDAITDSARLLKNGNTCFVTAVTRRGRDYVIKRYNPKGLLHSFRHTLKRSRARRGWLNAHRLHYLGIPTPRPVGFIEEYAGPFIKRSWLISEMAPGPKLHDYLADPAISKNSKSHMLDKVFHILDLLDRNRITHGDLKHVNLIITPDGPTLIDLDSLKIHRTGLFYRHYRNKDISAFDSIRD